MSDRQFNQLWELRFKKVYQAEKDSFIFYRDLLNRYGSILERINATAIIKRIIKEEIVHAKIAVRLMKIIKKRKKVCDIEAKIQAKNGNNHYEI